MYCEQKTNIHSRVSSEGTTDDNKTSNPLVTEGTVACQSQIKITVGGYIEQAPVYS